MLHPSLLVIGSFSIFTADFLKTNIAILILGGLHKPLALSTDSWRPPEILNVELAKCLKSYIVISILRGLQTVVLALLSDSWTPSEILNIGLGKSSDVLYYSDSWRSPKIPMFNLSKFLTSCITINFVEASRNVLHCH